MDGLRIIDAKQTLSAAVACVLTGVVALALAPLAADAAAPSFYAGKAVAVAVDVAVSPGQQALGQDRDAGALVAQAAVDSFGTSTGFASHPYPTDAVTGQVGSNYPFFVASSFPGTPKQVADNPGSRLSAVSDETETDASASGSPNIPGMDVAANSSVVKVIARPDGSLTATAEARARAVTVAGVLTIADLHSHASLTRSADGRLTRNRGLEIGALTVGGQAVELTDHGLQAAGQSLPLPTDAATQALKQAGITLKLIATGGSADTVSAPAVQITYAGDAPAAGSVSTSLLLGYTSASLSTKGQLASVSAVPPPVKRPPTATVTQPLRPSVGPAQVPGSAAGDVPALPPSTSAPALAGGGPPRVVPQAFATIPPYSWISLYVATLAAALALGLGAQFVRLMGVRAR